MILNEPTKCKRDKNIYLTADPLKYHVDECKHVYHLPQELLYGAVLVRAVVVVRGKRSIPSSLTIRKEIYYKTISVRLDSTGAQSKGKHHQPGY